jgi:hypothetical protein
MRIVLALLQMCRGCGAAVIIVTEQPDGMTNIFNGTYVAPGKVLTASTAEIIHGKTFVISAFLSPALSYAIEFSSEGALDFFRQTYKNSLSLIEMVVEEWKG